ncbi:MAG: O-antigen ligase family protein [Candidatus Sungbacteria bacterium]|uniref:O-antigen ligase family protein n=1 Tax=Candidatus Sungiibacteriota bacterium TaxID=2750080 RepID=A0A932VPN0_9BACT|nr:O-antigen ligase family protein [Candidatus Sungbacteria bacterium]
MQQSHHSSERIIAWAAKAGLFALLVLPLYVSTSLLFPFITGKNFAFRIIVEFVAVLWATLMLLDPLYRPRLTRLVKLSTIFIFIVFLADLFGPNPYRSFFSNYERMEGFMMIFHAWLYFLMLTSLMKTSKDWMIFFHTTLAASILVAGGALLQKFGVRISQQGGFRVDSTIGNPAYLAAYLMFHVWLGLILLGRLWRMFWLRILYGAAIVFEIIIVYFTATRGAVIALMLGAVFVLAASVLDWRRVFPQALRRPRWASALLALVLIVPIVFWQMRNTSLIKISPVLPRFASISLRETTTQSRFSIWRMSLSGALERPILGWGQENYYLVFQKYFDPKLYAQEPWFDRSHNLILDWAVHTGFLGLAGYLSLIGASVWGIIAAMRRGRMNRWEGLLLVSLFLTYVLQDLFVFDNLNTYLLFFGFLAYVDFLTAPRPQKPAGQSRGVNRAGAYALGSALFLGVAGVGYVIHIKPMLEAKALIRALVAVQGRAPLDQIQGAFETALQYHTFGDTEVREQLGNTSRQVPDDARSTDAEKLRFMDFALRELGKEVDRQSPDIKHMIFLAAMMDRAARLNPAYLGSAESLMRRAIKLSPTKQILYFQLAQIYLEENKPNDAIETLRSALYLEPSYQQAAVDLAIVGGVAKRLDALTEAGTYLRLDALDEDVLARVATAYQQVNDIAGAEKVFRRLIQKNPGNARYHATLAALLNVLGKKEEARLQADEAARIDPGFRAEADEFVRHLSQ